jgi:hypothetical protein
MGELCGSIVLGTSVPECPAQRKHVEEMSGDDVQVHPIPHDAPRELDRAQVIRRFAAMVIQDDRDAGRLPR